MESRPLRCFVAVAEELNFTRAAERLGISTPPLSRTIQRLESELGATLFERTTHSVTLTPAGEALLTEARFALDALDAAVVRARRAAADPKLVLAVKADGDAGLLEPILTRYATETRSAAGTGRTTEARYAAEARHTAAEAAVPVAVRLCAWQEQPLLLRRGEADVALVHEPYDRTGLDAEPLVVEERVAALAAGHRLAGRSRLSLDDLGLSPGEAHRHIERTRDRGKDLAQLLTLVGLGEVIPLFPASVAVRYPRPGVVYRPVVDAPPATLTVVWPQQSRSRAVAALVRAAVAVAEEHRERATG
ncbi:LysR family transcriptional regulator [Streptomyces sp. NPDC002643]